MAEKEESELVKAAREFVLHMSWDQRNDLNKYFNKMWYLEMHHSKFESRYNLIADSFIKKYEEKTKEKITVKQFEDALTTVDWNITNPETPCDD